MTSLVSATNFRSFADLAAVYKLDEDYRIVCIPRDGASTCVVAPHGGGIEAHTSEVARAIAGQNLSLYLFEGIRNTGNFATLHLTSHYFDESSCVQMVSGCDDVVTVHGCQMDGEIVLIGGLDDKLKGELRDAIAEAGFRCQTDRHAFPATNPANICNRGRRRAGVQLELSLDLRRSMRRPKLEASVREVLLARALRSKAINDIE